MPGFLLRTTKWSSTSIFDVFYLTDSRLVTGVKCSRPVRFAPRQFKAVSFRPPI